jgi:PhnB protein
MLPEGDYLVGSAMRFAAATGLYVGVRTGRTTTEKETVMAIEVQPAVTPHLVVDDAAAAIDFYVAAFGAKEIGRVPGPDGKLVHAALTINGFTVMLNDDFPEMCGGKSMTPKALGGTPVTIHLTVTDVESAFSRAVDAGATVVAPLEDQFWGDRYGVVEDPFGHHWSMGQPVREVSMEEIEQAMAQQQ